MHFLLLFSIFLVVTSSVFITLLFENKKIYAFICYLFAILFSQTIFTYEFLSLFSLIKPFYILLFNIVFFIISFISWKKYGKKPELKEDYCSELNKIKFIIKCDKWLKYSIIAFLIFIIGSLIFMYFVPVNDEDALSYHVARLPFWFEAKNLNHFECSDIRALIMPINSEIIYFWAYSFIKSDIFVRLFSFLSYILFLAGLRGFLKEMKTSVKVSLWVILSISAMQSVKLAITGTETNIVISAFLMSSLYLFVLAVKNKQNKNIFFSSLLFTLAIGTKTPVLQVIPSMALIFTVISFCFYKKEFYKPLFKFLGFSVINFILFSAYNYILNYIDFGNPITSVYTAEMHKFYGGIKGFLANLIRYLSFFIDISGFPFSVQFWRIKVAIINLLLAIMGIKTTEIDITPDIEFFELGNNFENMAGLGILGLILLLPSLIIALKRIKHSYKGLILGTIALAFVINILVLSGSLGYMIYSIRFFMFYAMCASPVLVYMFLCKKDGIFKKIIALILIYSFTFSYYFYERRFSPYMMYIFYKNPSIAKFKQKILSANVDFDTPSQASTIIDTIKADKKFANILYFAYSGANIYYPKHIEDKNYHIDFKLLETIEENDIDWQKYDYIVVPNIQENTNVKDIKKYKNAITEFNDGSDGNQVFYDFKHEIFANCVFASNRQENFKWLSEPENKITVSECFYKPDIIKSHGYKLIQKINSYDKEHKKQMNLYKNFSK